MTYYVTITSQGQMSIPVNLRRSLGLDKSRKAMVREEEGKMVVEPVPDILSLRGVFKTKRKIPFWKTRKAFEEALSRGEA